MKISLVQVTGLSLLTTFTFCYIADFKLVKSNATSLTNIPTCYQSNTVPDMTTSTIYDEAKSGKLTKASLEQYMANGEDIDGLNTARKYTPLMTAVLNGHKQPVKILLHKKANVNIATDSGETALWLAASKTTKNRQNIVDLLLDAKPDLNANPSIGSRNTPVMEAIIQFRDEGVVSRLVDAGADLGKTNSRDKTAYDLAEETQQLGLKVALLPASERKKHRVPIVMRVLNFINHIIAIANAVILAITGDVSPLRSLLGLGGYRDSALPKVHSLAPW